VLKVQVKVPLVLVLLVSSRE